MSLPDGRRKGTCSLWLKRSEPRKKPTVRGARRRRSNDRAGNWVLLSDLALASAALSVLLYIEPAGARVTRSSTNNHARRLGDKKTTYDTHDDGSERHEL